LSPVLRHFVAGIAIRQTIGALSYAFIGAAIGTFVAWLLKVTGHPPWAVLLMLFCAIAPAMTIAFNEPKARVRALMGRIRWQASPWLKFLVVLVLIGCTAFVLDEFGVNPRNHAYLPLLPAILASALILGFGPALVGIIVGTAVTDYFYAPPPRSFGVADWKDAAAMAIFGMVGAINALMIHQLVSSRHQPRFAKSRGRARRNS
jgi:K+-sensing histidine kinase KdpD